MEVIQSLLIYIYKNNYFWGNIVSKKQRVVILGGGPNRIGQGLEFIIIAS